ncbi:hypothetical protein ABZX39_21800 [Streptomyces collinus]|uniref:hypothetical protein n=1 Tax=Streptomyces collinus TaxID=42684 RepID=UPI0033B5BEC7
MLLLASGICVVAIGIGVFTGPFHVLGRPAGFLALLLGSRVIRASRLPAVADLQDLAKF